MTFPPIYLIDESRIGRKKLMVGSALVMTISSALLGWGIVGGYKVLSAICMILMVAGFSFGLGPIPFVILPELVPSRVSITPLIPSIDYKQLTDRLIFVCSAAGLAGRINSDLARVDVELERKLYRRFSIPPHQELACRIRYKSYRRCRILDLFG